MACVSTCTRPGARRASSPAARSLQRIQPARGCRQPRRARSCRSPTSVRSRRARAGRRAHEPPRRGGRAAAGRGRLRAYARCARTGPGQRSRALRRASWSACSAAAASAMPASGRRWPRSPSAWPTASSSPTTIRAARMATRSSRASCGASATRRRSRSNAIAHRAIAARHRRGPCRRHRACRRQGPRALPGNRRRRRPSTTARSPAGTGGTAMLNLGLATIARWTGGTPARCRSAHQPVSTDTRKLAGRAVRGLAGEHHDAHDFGRGGAGRRGRRGGRARGR